MEHIDYYVLTQIMIDDLYFTDQPPQFNLLGGGCYTVAGMRLLAERVGICSGIGPDFYGNFDKWFLDNKIHVAGAPREQRCLHSMLRYFQDGEREEILLEGYGSYEQMQPAVSEIPSSYDCAKGMYFFKDCQLDFWSDMTTYLKHRDMVSVWEIFGATAAPENKDIISQCMESVSLFSLNMTEGKRLTQEQDPVEIVKALHKMQAKVVILRMSERGCIVSDGKAMYHVPIAPGDVVDVTGGGNSSTGGFLVGYCESEGDIVTAGRYANAAASIVIGQHGVPLSFDESWMNLAKQRAEAIPVTRL